MAGSQFGVGADDYRMLIGGWWAEQAERWTVGYSAGIVLGAAAPVTLLTWIATLWWRTEPLALSVGVVANGARVGAVERDPTLRSGAALGHVAAGTELSLDWRLREPRSTRELGLSEDPRPLGQFFRDGALL